MMSIRKTLVDVLGRLWALEQLSDPASVAAGLTAKDFGNDVNAKIGLNYMKGEIEVLRDELAHAQSQVVELREENRKTSGELATLKWRLGRIVQERDSLQERLNALDNQTEEGTDGT